MIPEFPEFKNIELSDAEAIENFTKDFLPYSDFNFVSMWSWDVKGEILISKLNNNLVVRFVDYLNYEHFYSFLGNNKVNETIELLLEVSKEEGLDIKLKLIPEDSLKELDKSKFKVEESRDHFDYIYDLKKLSLLKGSEYSTKRSEINRFVRDNKKIEVKEIILDKKTKFNILKLNYEWLENKKRKDPFFDVGNELIAIGRFLELDSKNIRILGIFLENKLVAYSVNEISKNDKYSTGHFYKTLKFNGLFDLLMVESSKFMLSLGKDFMNFEQDLGLEGLRFSKDSYGPVFYLKKYTVSRI